MCSPGGWNSHVCACTREACSGLVASDQIYKGQWRLVRNNLRGNSRIFLHASQAIPPNRLRKGDCLFIRNVSLWGWHRAQPQRSHDTHQSDCLLVSHRLVCDEVQFLQGEGGAVPMRSRSAPVYSATWLAERPVSLCHGSTSRPKTPKSITIRNAEFCGGYSIQSKPQSGFMCGTRNLPGRLDATQSLSVFPLQISAVRSSAGSRSGFVETDSRRLSMLVD